MKTAIASIIAAFLVLPLVACAQGTSPTPSPSPTRTPMWRCDLPGGSYEVAIHFIISVSTHEYLVDGAARVTELNIETPGSTEVRFYYLEPNTPSSPIGIGQSTLDKAQELAEEAAGRVSPSERPWEKVVKNYPTTTHAHTVEYRLDTKDQVEQLFNSVEQAFRLGQNTQITIGQ
ncbi:MAG TPA: hypothetical protein VHY22_00045 [Chthoniobacteraceae bacterium]|jgi:hypothetical protein|nr:hypothetical protein [Chthoniobacteraceae bacterium]